MAPRASRGGLKWRICRMARIDTLSSRPNGGGSQGRTPPTADTAPAHTKARVRADSLVAQLRRLYDSMVDEPMPQPIVALLESPKSR